MIVMAIAQMVHHERSISDSLEEAKALIREQGVQAGKDLLPSAPLAKASDHSQALQKEEGEEEPEGKGNSPHQEEEEKSNIKTEEHPQGEVIGILEIPRLQAELPIVEGTSADQLRKGVGHYATTLLPGEGGQILLSGHRDTVFTRMGELKEGDQFIVRTRQGSYTYTFTRSKIVDADDTTVIRHSDREELVLSTCYPFSFLGNAPDRYVIYAYPM